MKLSIEGYKSIVSEKSIDINGLTILAGANSSGKSSFMQPWLILKQTVESHYDSGSVILDGANIKITDSSQIIPKFSSRIKFFSVKLGFSAGWSQAKYKYTKNKGIAVESTSLMDNDLENILTLKLGMTSDEIEKMIPKKEFHLVYSFYKKNNIPYKWHASRDKCFVFAEVKTAPNKRTPLSAGFDPSRPIHQFVSSLIHVPGLRGNPERTYKISASEDIYPGSFEQYVASTIHRWDKSNKHDLQYKELIENLSLLGLAEKIHADKINDTRLEIKVSRHKNCDENDSVNIADVGFGVSQILPVLVALLCAKKAQPVYIEQPELHLHPKAQVQLAKIIAKAVNRGVLVIVETHSSLFLRGIQIEVVKGNLEKEKVSLNWFTQNNKNGETEISQAILDEYGAFGDWPEDFDETSLKVEQAYLDAVEEAVSA